MMQSQLKRRTGRQRKSRARRWTERLLLLVGIAGVGIWIWSNASASVYQDWQNWTFDRQRRGQETPLTAYLSEKAGKAAADVRAWLKLGPAKAPSAPAPTAVAPSRPAPTPAPVPTHPEPPTVPPNGVIGRLAIPRLHLSAMVREGVEEDTLSLALGHIPSTAFPGQQGNIGVAGHRDTLFRKLRDIRAHDVIRFETLNGNYEYQVQSTQVVSPKDVSVLKPGLYPELTLVTCYPFYYVGPAPDRFIVKAREISPKPAPSAEQVTQSQQPERAVETAAAEPREEPLRRGSADRSNRREESPKSVVKFEIVKSHSRQLAPGISMGLTDTDPTYRRADGWMWVMPDRKTIWLRGQRAQEPLIFYRDGRMRELVITKISNNSVSGYVRAPGGL